MIKRFIILGMAALIMLADLSCISDNDSGRISKQEERRLVELARVFILHNKRTIVTPAEAEFMRSNYPEVDAIYEGYKRGLLSISWNTRNRRIVARLYGAMREDNRAWRVSIYFRPQVTITPKARARMHPVQTAGVKDFVEIFSQQGVKSRPRPKQQSKVSGRAVPANKPAVKREADNKAKFILPPGSPKVREVKIRLTP